MKNIWLGKKALKNYPIGSRILVTGPFDPRMPDIDRYLLYIDELGTVVEHNGEGGWVGVVLDKLKNHIGNNTIWFAGKEIVRMYDFDLGEIKHKLIDYVRWNPFSGIELMADILQEAADEADNGCDPGTEAVLQEAIDALKKVRTDW